MLVKGDVRINAPLEKVWEFLVNPHVVARCAPGVESLEIIIPDRQFRAVASIGFGSAKVTFITDVEWLEMESPYRAKMKAHGIAPGSAADVVAEMSLVSAGDSFTELAWWADVTISGTIASLASRLMGSVTQKLTDLFFDCVRKQIET